MQTANDESALRKELTTARSQSDAPTERRAALSLARLLSERGRAPEEAVALGLRALEIEPDSEAALDVSRWLEGLGEHARGGALLASMVDSGILPRSQRIRGGVFYARAGDARGARKLLELAAEEDVTSALPLELLGAISSWAPDVVSREFAAAAYLEASRRRGGEDSVAQDDAIRAVEADPANEAAARELARKFAEAKPRNEDEILRSLAQSLTRVGKTKESSDLHAERFQRALARGDVASALGAAFDAGFDRAFFGAGAALFDEMLLRAGALEMLAARLEFRGARAASSRERARAYAALARLSETTLSDKLRAFEAYREWSFLDPDSEEARVATAACRPSIARLVALPDPIALAWRQPDLASSREALESWAREPQGGIRRAARAWVAATALEMPAIESVALHALATELREEPRALLLSLAADRQPRDETALPWAEEACSLSSNLPRLLTTLVDKSSSQRTRTVAAVLELLMKHIGPRAPLASRLSEILTELGEPGAAVSWAQHAVTLVPGDVRLASAVIRCATLARDPERLSDGIFWALAQPIPATELAELSRIALSELVLLDIGRSAALARRIVDALGPHPTIYPALQKVVELSGDGGLAHYLGERYLSNPENRARELDRLSLEAERRGDVEGEAMILARALRQGALVSRMFDRIEVLERGNLPPETRLLLVEGRALLLASDLSDASIPEAVRKRVDPELVAGLWREVAELRVSISGDKIGAIDAWRKALDASSNVQLAELAAQTALDLDEPVAAFEFARLSLDRHPDETGALEIAEKGAMRANRLPELSELYERVAKNALGRFGRRGAHYRAARIFEIQNDLPRALEHAARAFEAVPAEGAALDLLSRISSESHDHCFAARTVSQVAEISNDRAHRSRWLVLAARIAPEEVEGLRLRVDALLRAVVQVPDADTATALVAATAALLKASPTDADALRLRAANAVRALSARLEGPSGGRLGVILTSLMLDLFNDGDGGLAALEKALLADGDLQEYERLLPFADRLAKARDIAAFLERMLVSASQGYCPFGVPTLTLFAALADIVPGVKSSAQFIVRGAIKDSDNVPNLARASLLVSGLDDEALRALYEKRIDKDEEAAALRTRLEQEDASDTERVRARLAELVPDDPEALRLEEERLTAAGDYDALAPKLRSRAERLRDAGEEGAARSVFLRYVAILEQRLDRIGDARIELERLVTIWPNEGPLLRYLADLHEREGRGDLAAPIWSRLREVAGGDASKLDLDLHAARALFAAGKSAEAEERVRDVLAHSPNDHLATKLLGEIESARGRASIPAPPSTPIVPMPPSPSTPTSSFPEEFDSSPAIPLSVPHSRPREAITGGPAVLQLVEHEPVFDIARLRQKRAAASNEQATYFVRVLDHVLFLLGDGDAPLRPPPLSHQSEQPGLLRHLNRSTQGVSAFELLWENMPALFAKDAASYSITGVDQVAPGPTTPLSRLYELTLRLLDLPKMPLYVRGGLRTASSETRMPLRRVSQTLRLSQLELSPTPPSVAGLQAASRLSLAEMPVTRPPQDLEVTIAVRVPPSIILKGDVREDSLTLRSRLGSSFSGALPAHVLAAGLPEEQLTSIWEALLRAFGTEDNGSRDRLSPNSVRYAEAFWGAPPKVQRQLSEIVHSAPSLAATREHIRQSGRRTALFVTGDLGFALEELLGADAVLTPESLRRAVENSDAAKDLVELFLEPIFADARWRLSASGSGDASGRAEGL